MTYTPTRWSLDALVPAAEAADLDKRLKGVERRLRAELGGRLGEPAQELRQRGKRAFAHGFSP